MVGSSRSRVTTKATAVPVEEFLATVSNARLLADAEEIIAIMRRVSGEEPVMWGPTMVGFGRHHYRYDSGHEGETFVMGLSPRSAAMSVYGLYNAYDPDPRFASLGRHTVGKGCLYIKVFAAIDRELFETIVKDAWVRQGAVAEKPAE